MRRNSAATRAARCGRLTSLVRKSSAPSRSPDTASSSLSRAVRKMMGSSAESARRSRHRSKPPSASSSSEMSMMARSGSWHRRPAWRSCGWRRSSPGSRAAPAPRHSSRARPAHPRRSRCAFFIAAIIADDGGPQVCHGSQNDASPQLVRIGPRRARIRPKNRKIGGDH